jgi:hypothetical protein
LVNSSISQSSSMKDQNMIILSQTHNKVSMKSKSLKRPKYKLNNTMYNK